MKHSILIIIILQFQSQRSMLKRTNYSKSNRNDNKTQKSQDNKVIRTRKQEGQSPIIKQIIINKQNIHPNKESLKTEKYAEKYKQIYYNIKQQSANSKQDKYKLQQNDIIDPSKNILNFHYLLPSKQIEIKINNKSLQKCQIHPLPRLSPKATFIANQNNKKQILCCLGCSHQFQNKIQIQKLSDILIAPDLTIKQYYQQLNEKLNNLQTIQQNMSAYEKQFRQMCTKQCQKHRKYYNQILQIIEILMKESESIISNHINDGQRKINQKKSEIAVQLEFIKQQMRKLLLLQQNQYKGRRSSSQVQFNIQKASKNIQTNLKLSAIHLYTEVPNIYQNFEKVFKQHYNLKILTREEIFAEENKQKQAKQTERMSNNLSINQSYKTTIRHEESDSDFLFCDEEIGDRTNKTQDFSFDQSCDENISGIKKTNDCIMQLVQQEQVISPVFKAI